MRKIGLFLSTLCCAASLAGDELSWSSPQAISTLEINASSPVIGGDSNGNTFALWVEEEAIVFSTKAIDGEWTTPTPISDIGASSPEIYVDPSGNTTAVWVESDGIKTSFKPFDDGWESTVTLSEANATTPQIRGDAAGDVVVIWAREGQIESSTRLFSGSWPEAPDVLSTTGTCDFPQISIGTDDTVFAIWHAEVNTPAPQSDVIYAASKAIAGAWDTAALVSDPSIHCVYPQVAVDGSGNALAVWYRYAFDSYYSNVGVQTAEKTAGGSWTIPVNRSDSGFMDPANLMARAAFDGNGNAIVMWTQSLDGATIDLQHAIKTISNGWLPTQILVSNVYDYAFDLNVTSNGLAYLIYMTYRNIDSALEIFFTETDIAGTNPGNWDVPKLLSTGTLNAFPLMNTQLSGIDLYTSAVWLGYDGSNQVIEAVTATGSIMQPPVNFQIVQASNDFNIFTEYYNTLSWEASPSPETASYFIYRDGVYFEQVDAETFSYIDHNQKENGMVTYGISASDDSFCQSIITEVSFP
jgi:hypothetical protein